VLDAHVYESPSFVKKERTMGASVNLPFVYPSIGVSLAPVGCFEVALAAPSVDEPKAQLAFELASTSTGSRLLVAFFPFFPSRLFKKPPIVQDRQLPPVRRRVVSSHDTADGSSGWPRPRPRHFPACLRPANAERISASTGHSSPGDGRLQSTRYAAPDWRLESSPRRLAAG